MRVGGISFGVLEQLLGRTNCPTPPYRRSNVAGTGALLAQSTAPAIHRCAAISPRSATARVGQSPCATADAQGAPAARCALPRDRVRDAERGAPRERLALPERPCSSACSAPGVARGREQRLCAPPHALRHRRRGRLGTPAGVEPRGGARIRRRAGVERGLAAARRRSHQDEPPARSS